MRRTEECGVRRDELELNRTGDSSDSAADGAAISDLCRGARLRQAFEQEYVQQGSEAVDSGDLPTEVSYT